MRVRARTRGWAGHWVLKSHSPTYLAQLWCAPFEDVAGERVFEGVLFVESRPTDGDERKRGAAGRSAAVTSALYASGSCNESAWKFESAFATQDSRPRTSASSLSSRWSETMVGQETSRPRRTPEACARLTVTLKAATCGAGVERCARVERARNDGRGTEVFGC